MTGAASANFRLDFETDATGTPTTGSYSGSGTLDANITTGTAGFEIIGVSNGDSITTEIYDDSTAQNFSPDIMGQTTTFGLTGGTADIGLSVGGTGFKGWGAYNMDGVSELNLVTVFSEPVHGRTNNLTRLDGYPWGFSTGLLSAGTGLNPENFEITYTISDLYHSDTPTVAGSYVAGLDPTGVSAYAAAGWDSTTFSSTDVVFSSTNGFEGINDSSTGADINNLTVRGLDDDGGSLTLNNVREYYATTFEVSIRPTGVDTNGDPITEFAADTRFVFSYDGDRMLSIAPVPEPSSTVLLVLTLAAGLGRRRRTCA